MGVADEYLWGENFVEDVFDTLFVNRSGIGMQQTDGDSLYVFCDQTGCGSADGHFVQVAADFTGRANSLVDFQSQTTRYKWCRFDIVEVVKFRHPDTAKFQYIAETLRRNKSGAGTFTFQNGIGGDGGRVNHFTDFGRINGIFFHYGGHAERYCPTIIIRCG